VVQEILNPTVDDFNRLNAAGVTPLCTCSQTAMPFSSFVSFNTSADGYCLLMNRLQDICVKLPIYCQSSLGDATFGVFIRASQSICQLADKLTNTTLLSFKVCATTI
jgi:hypothetical protein